MVVFPNFHFRLKKGTHQHIFHFRCVDENIFWPRFEIKRLKLPVLTSGRGLKWGKLKTTTKKENWGKRWEIQCSVL